MSSSSEEDQNPAGTPEEENKDEEVNSDIGNNNNATISDDITATSTNKNDDGTANEEEEKNEDSSTNGNDKEKSKDEETETEEEDPMELVIQAMTHKDAGNAYFKSGELSQASRSYRRGTNLLKNLNINNTGDDQVKSLLLSLQTNLSMVCSKLNKHPQARDVASKALDVDPKNVKALYRRAVANKNLGNCEAALSDLREALKYEPSNRDVRREFVSVKKEVEKSRAKRKEGLAKAFSSKGSSFLYDDKEEEGRRKAEEEKAKKEAKKEAIKKRKLEWEEECVQRMSKGEDAITYEDWDKERTKKEEEAQNALKKAKKEEEARKRAARAAAAAASKNGKESESDDDDDELTEKELQMLRGYKKTSDGRTTSYFTREQTEEEKNLLGNIAPQRLDGNSNSQAPVAANNNTTSTPASSAWNQAGTWEERDTSTWCNSSLSSHLSQATVKSGSYTGLIKKVDDLTGDASVAFVSGKKRYVFDYHATLKFEITTDAEDAEDDIVASGTFKLADISSTAINDEVEVEIMAWKKAPAVTCVDQATLCRDELVKQVQNQVLVFVSAFNSQY